METNNIFYITHIVPDELPIKGLRKLLFYTTPDPNENHKKYYWGKSVNSFDEAFMAKLEDKDEVLRLPTPVKVKNGFGLWLNPEGKIVVADLKKPFGDGDMDVVWAPKELSKSAQQYRRDIGTQNIPRTNRVVSI